MEFFFVIIALLVIANFYFLFKRGKRGRNVGKKVTQERIEKVKHHDNLVRRLDFEQRHAAKKVELQNRTFEMYEQVRKQAEENERTENADS